MPLPSENSKDHRPRRSRARDPDHAAGQEKYHGSGHGTSLASLRSLALGLLAVMAICGWQFMLLSRHVEMPSAQEVKNQGTVNEAMWHYLGLHEANLTALGFQQRDLAHLVGQLGEDLRRQHEELLAVEQRLGGAGGGAGHGEAARQAAFNKIAEETQMLQSHADATVPTATHHQADPGGERPRAAPTGVDAGATHAGSTRQGDFPAEWLKRFSREELQASAKEAEKWREGARQTFMHAWNGYKQKAWGKDELKPMTGSPGRTWANVGLQILDALSTMWIMELHEPFDESAKWIEESLRFDYTGMVSFFELTIRGLGGLLSAYSLSGREIFLTRAKELADKMLPAFQDEEPGFPFTQVNLRTGKGAGGWFSGTVLAEAGTVQLEFRYLSQVTGDPKYQKAADRAMRSILQAAKGRGLLPWGLSRKGPVRFVNNHITFGAMGDSYYEYLLKMYLQTSQTEPEWIDAWKKAMQEMQQRLILKTRGGLTYIAEENAGQKKHKMDHLACFVGGMMIYGARKLPAHEVDKDWESIGAGITETCYQMYHRQPSHLAPECVTLLPDAGPEHDMTVWQNAGHYLLRPEAAEAIFYMFYYTGDPKYRRMAGEIYEAIETHTKTTYGYSAVRDVRQPNPQMRNEMETFFLAETMKYLYLTFVPNPQEVLNLDEFVLTTEAHPIRIHRPGQANGFLSRARG